MSDIEESWVEGIISATAVLQAGNRPMFGLYIYQRPSAKYDPTLAQLLRLAKAQQIPIESVDEAFLTQHSQGKSHGGLLARVGARRLSTLADLIQDKTRPFIVMLDGIEDPFNFGQAIRALYAAGADGLVVRPRNWLTAVSTVTRSSAGASEWMPTAVANTAEEAAAFFRQHGLAVACTSREKATSLYQTDLTQPLFLLLGGEKRGITRAFLQQADLRLAIPYGREPFAASLGTVAATAVVAFERLRQTAQAAR